MKIIEGQHVEVAEGTRGYLSRYDAEKYARTGASCPERPDVLFAAQEVVVLYLGEAVVYVALAPPLEGGVLEGGVPHWVRLEDLRPLGANTEHAAVRKARDSVRSALEHLSGPARGGSTSPTAGGSSSPTAGGGLPYAVFATDPRVVRHAELRLETSHEVGGEVWAEAVKKLWHLGKEGHSPERDWYREAHELAERIGRPWHEVPQPTILEALASAAREDLTPLGFMTTSIPGGGQGEVHAHAQIDIAGRYLCLGKEAAKLLVRDIRVGMMSLLASADPIPGTAFAPGAFPFRLHMPRICIGSRVTLMLTNVEHTAACVNAVVYGSPRRWT